MSTQAPRRVALSITFLIAAVVASACTQESGALAFTGEPGRDNQPRAWTAMPVEMSGATTTSTQADPFRAAKLAAPHSPHAESF